MVVVSLRLRLRLSFPGTGTGMMRLMHDHPGEVCGSGEHAHPGLASLVEARVGCLGAEDEE